MQLETLSAVVGVAHYSSDMYRYNTEESIKGFAKACFEYALNKKWYVLQCSRRSANRNIQAF